MSEAVELATVTRGGFVESRHSGTAIVLSPAGDTMVSLGDPHSTILTRSALKPLQSLAMHLSGLKLDNDRQRALSLASHNGTETHVSVAREILGEIPESFLACPAAYPVDRDSKNKMIRAGIAPQAITMGCSGKHAAMLRTCDTNGWDLTNYTDVEHPLQQNILETVQRFSGERPAPVTVDGCGVPTLGLTAVGLARAYRRMATADAASPFPVNRISASLLQAGKRNPDLIEGPRSHDTLVMQHADVFAKYGAEGISAMAAPDGTVVVVKILDGSSRASRPVALSLLAYVGAVSKTEFSAALSKMSLTIAGGGKPIGDIRVSIPALK
ncbi:MAG: asparaginase [Canibacter sp.]